MSVAYFADILLLTSWVSPFMPTLDNFNWAISTFAFFWFVFPWLKEEVTATSPGVYESIMLSPSLSLSLSLSSLLSLSFFFLPFLPSSSFSFFLLLASSSFPFFLLAECFLLLFLSFFFLLLLLFLLLLS